MLFRNEEFTFTLNPIKDGYEVRYDREYSLSLTLVKVKNGYKPSNYAGCSHSPFRNDLCYFFVSSVLVLFIMLRIVDFEINS